LSKLAVIEPKADYDRKNEAAFREEVRSLGDNSYDKRGNLTVPIGKKLQFTSPTGVVVTLGFESGNFTIQQNTSTPTSMASISYVTTVETTLTTSIASLTVEVAAANDAAAAAAVSASSAATSATAAGTSATAAQTSATTASTQASNAATSASQSSTSETNAAGSAATATTQATNAANSATNAGNSATAASGSASTAATQATAAGNSATASQNSATSAATQASNAATSAGAASTSEGNAATSASQASTSASNAAGSASSASTSATNAANSSTSAGNSATAASTSASQASTSATNAGNSASSASTSATNAANSATAAGGSASAAATSASSASTSATNAGNSATSSQSSAVTAASSAAQTYPGSFENDGYRYFTHAVAGTPGSDLSTGTTVTVSGIGQVYQVTAYTEIYGKAYIAVGSGRTHKLLSKARTSTDGSTASAQYFAFACFDSSFAYLGMYGTNSDTNRTASEGWSDDGPTLTSAQIVGVYPTAVYIRTSATFVPGTGATMQLALLRYVDASESAAAGASATASATSASNASTSASGAATSASAANTSATTATTQASNASTSASQASTSAGNAATSASTATTQASNAAGSASTASTQASNASASASAASNSATLSATFASGSQGSINSSATFADNTVTSGIPTNWFDWSSGTSSTRVTGIAPQPYAVTILGGAGVNGGIYQPMHGRVSTGWHVLEADVTLNSGALTGAGLLINSDPATVYTEVPLIFSTDTDINGSVVGAGTTGRLYKFRKLVQITVGDTYTHIYAMSHYTSFGSVASANSITWHRCAIRAASQAEIEARQAKLDLVTTNANVASNTSAIATNTSAIASQGTTITANLVTATDVGVNLVPNSTGLRGKTGWEGAAANWGTYEHPLWGHWFNRVFTGATVTEDFYTSQITANPGEQYSLSFVPYIAGLSSGSVRIYVAWYNSGGTYINEGPSLYLGPSVHRVRQKLEAIAAPAGTAYMRFVVTMSGAVGAGGYAETGFWQAKIEQGIRATAWRADGDLINNFARLTSAEASIVTNASAIATETSARTSADTTLTANFTALRSGNDADSLPSTFEKDDLYWTQSGGSFVTVSTIGRVYQSTALGHSIQSRGRVQLRPSRTYRFTARYRVETNSTSGTNPKPLAGLQMYNSAGTNVNGYWVGSFVSRTVADGWVTVTADITTAQFLAVDATTVEVGVYSQPNWHESGSPNATVQLQFAKLEDVTDITTTNATVASNTSAIATETSARAAADTTLSAKINVNGNRFPYPQPLSTTLPAGWVGTGLEVGTWQPLGGNFYYRPRSSGGSATTEYYYYDVEPTASAWVSTGEQYTLSAVGYGGAGTSGDRLLMWLEYYNSSNTMVYSSPQVLLASYAPPERYSTTAAFTSGGEYVRRRVVFAREWAASGSYQDTVFNYIKLERGPVATAYTADGALTPLQASVTTNASAIATVNGAAAFWETIVSAGGGDLSAVRLKAGATGSYIELISTVLRLANVSNGAVIEVMRAINGEAFFSRPISSDSASRRLTIGPGYGVSGSEVVLWFGPVATAPSSQSRTNGYFALGTDGKIYFGSTDLAVLTTPMTATITGSVSTSHNASVTPTVNTTVSVTAVTNGTSPYTYQWALIGLEPDTAATELTGVTASAVDVYRGATLATNSDYGVYLSCTITDANGKQCVKHWSYVDVSTAN